ncbi:DUF3606 domain-containing protein [Sphingobium yanoikuyae]|uniref:DUF3606 domain-containing protein n=1 Tax=Sphingobium TaxID=165695 RepID=UPI0028A9E002|nr:DUF3606 domain-containing protein [Sphingobium yanoikuyae]
MSPAFWALGDYCDVGQNRGSPDLDHYVSRAAPYWTGKFGVSKERLEDAVKAVGSSADAVEQHLKG